MKTDGFHRLLALLLKRATEPPRSIRVRYHHTSPSSTLTKSRRESESIQETYKCAYKWIIQKYVWFESISYCIHAFAILSSYYFYSETLRYLFYGIFRLTRLCTSWFISTSPRRFELYTSTNFSLCQRKKILQWFVVLNASFLLMFISFPLEGA